MTQEEFIEEKQKDTYLVERESPSQADIRLFLREVNFYCPLCGKELQSKKQKKKECKNFEIAHIYPNSPTKEQYEILLGSERLGENCEAFENKIALCLDCHKIQDFRTTKIDYLKLVGIKKERLRDTILNDVVNKLSLEEEIKLVLEKIIEIKEEELVELNYKPVQLSKKISSNETLLKKKISAYVTNYFPYIREIFKGMEGKRDFIFSVLSSQIKICFQKIEQKTKDKVIIFNKLVDWIAMKTLVSSREACEAVVSFFVQECEVFYEISE